MEPDAEKDGASPPSESPATEPAAPSPPLDPRREKILRIRRAIKVGGALIVLGAVATLVTLVILPHKAQTGQPPIDDPRPTPTAPVPSGPPNAGGDEKLPWKEALRGPTHVAHRKGRTQVVCRDCHNIG